MRRRHSKSGIRKTTCDICGISFKNSGLLKRHKSRAHKLDDLVCENNPDTPPTSLPPIHPSKVQEVKNSSSLDSIELLRVPKIETWCVELPKSDETLAPEAPKLKKISSETPPEKELEDLGYLGEPPPEGFSLTTDLIGGADFQTEPSLTCPASTIESSGESTSSTEPSIDQNSVTDLTTVVLSKALTRKRRKSSASVLQTPKTFLCSFCGKSFPILQSLNSHLFTHGAREKKVECQVCQKRFNDRKDLRNHMATHVSYFYIVE